MEDLKLEVARLMNDGVFAAFASGDYEKCASFYDPDVVMLPPGSDFVKGNDGIAVAYKEMKESGIARWVNAEVVMVTKLCDDYMISHSYEDAYDATGKLLARYTDMMVWKKRDNNWTIWRDMYHTME